MYLVPGRPHECITDDLMFKNLRWIPSRHFVLEIHLEYSTKRQSENDEEGCDLSSSVLPLRPKSRSSVTDAAVSYEPPKFSDERQSVTGRPRTPTHTVPEKKIRSDSSSRYKSLEFSGTSMDASKRKHRDDSIGRTFSTVHKGVAENIKDKSTRSEWTRQYQSTRLRHHHLPTS